MGDAFEALADIRRWACETLDASDAGKLCGMLSDMSRHANGLESQNAKLRELVRDMWHDGMCDCDEFRVCVHGEYHCAECEYHYPDRMRELGIEVERWPS